MKRNAYPNAVFVILFFLLLAPLLAENYSQLTSMGQSWLLSSGQSGYDEACDFNLDNTVNFKDYAFLVQHAWHGDGDIYFVSDAAGSDTNNGNVHHPFKTIQKAATVTYPGDICFVRGGTYRETVTPSRNGTADKPIHYEGYPGETATLNGTDLITGSWSVHSGNIYKKTIVQGLWVPRPFDFLFVDGEMYNEARWPNAKVNQFMGMPKAVTDSGTNATTLVDNNLPAGDWNGAKVHIVAGYEWNGFTRTITNYNPGVSFNFDNTNWADEYGRAFCFEPDPGDKYWIFGSLDGLDIATEWALKEEGSWFNKRFDCYLWCDGDDTPESHLVEMRKRKWGFDLSNRNYIQVRGLRLFANTVLMDNSQYCLVEDCDVKYADLYTDVNGRWTSHHTHSAHATRMSGSNNEWKDCSIVYSAGNGIYDYGTNNKVTGCIIRTANFMALDGGNLYVHDVAGGGVYTGNTMYDSGRFIVYPDGTPFTLTHNHLHSTGYLTKDCGIIYLVETQGAWSEIAYNYVHDNHSLQFPKGIYVDLWNDHITIHHNLIWNMRDSAIIMSMPIDHVYVYNNTIMESCSHVFSYNDHGTDPNHATCKVINNLHNCTFGWLLESPPDRVAEIHHNGDYTVDANGYPTPGSGAIDAGYEIPGITDGFLGDAPDIGAFEYGAEPWTAGTDREEPAWMDNPFGEKIIDPSAIVAAPGYNVPDRNGLISTDFAFSLFAQWAVNGSGLYAGQHVDWDTGTMYMDDDAIITENHPVGIHGVYQAFVNAMFDDSYFVESLHIWNFNAPSPDRGFKNVDIHASNDYGQSYTLLGSFVFDKASGVNGDRGFYLDIPDGYYTDIVISAKDNWGDSYWIGLAEVQFVQSGSN